MGPHRTEYWLSVAATRCLDRIAGNESVPVRAEKRSDRRDFLGGTRAAHGCKLRGDAGKHLGVRKRADSGRARRTPGIMLFAQLSVATAPIPIAFTRMPSFATSSASDLVKLLMAALRTFAKRSFPTCRKAVGVGSSICRRSATWRRASRRSSHPNPPRSNS
jgi:hypothetical protein